MSIRYICADVQLADFQSHIKFPLYSDVTTGWEFWKLYTQEFGFQQFE